LFLSDIPLHREIYPEATFINLETLRIIPSETIQSRNPLESNQLAFNQFLDRMLETNS